jgi:hypothetical protein
MNLAERSLHEMNPSANSAQNKKRKGNLSRCTFLLSLDLRDYPIEKWGFSPSVSRSKTGIFPGFR